jgi:serine/threonine protein kinase
MDGRLLLTDFGSAAPLIADPGGAFVNQQHCILPVGTPDYVAPEVLELAELALVNSALGDHRHGGHSLRGYSSRVDWWSLGVTMYEMAVGRAPFWAESIRETYELILKLEVRLRSRTC